jgi:2-polyprenyl-3-methyl-5-hydroxy-6-metoxy-1,4-benzoquinol methylase
MASIIDERGFNQGFKLTEAQRIRLHRRAESIVAEIDLPVDPEMRKKIHILELGCGTGELAYQLAIITSARVTGVDLSQKFVDHANSEHKHSGLSFVVADLSETAPSSETQRYDYIVGNGILHHLYYHLDRLLPALALWLKPGGKLIFWEPNLYNPYIYLIFSFPFFRRLARLEPDEMAFSSDYISRKLKIAGFHEIRATTRDFLLPNTPKIFIKSIAYIGAIAEKIPLLRRCAQSVFLHAKR